MRLRVLLGLLAIIAACCHGRSDPELGPGRHDDPPCDPRGPADPPNREGLASAMRGYVARELFPDEQALRERCSLEEVDLAEVVEDEGVMERCEHVATTRAPAASRELCRRACLIAGRAAVAVLVHTRIVNALEHGSPRASACRVTTAGVVDGEEAARLWSCFGNPSIPKRMQISFAFVADPASPTAPRLERVIVDGPLVPNHGVYAFAYGKTDHGCGHTGYSVEVFPPERQ